MSETAFRCGYVAIIGRPNVGKSTLMNHILGMKLSITSRKPQTTRHQIMGVMSTQDSQAIYVDTPGIHDRRNTAINKYMNRSALSVIDDVDVVVFVVQALQWTDEDKAVLERLERVNAPVILAINKIDRVRSDEELLPFISELSSKADFTEVIPISALRNKGVDALQDIVHAQLPQGEPVFEEDQVTDRSVRFLSAEIVREKLVRELGQELPYTTAVDIESFEESDKLVKIHAIIYVESDGQKAIIIGKKGDRLKSIGSSARADIQKLIDTRCT